ncbi:hypothetical protein PV326_003091 [Microctonus aethiopoides]|nr:hypothetical protein PV326_003091 [Microctonus aethiopoides]
MAQQDNGPCWDSLPSVIMLEIFSYLEHKDRINASGVCKNWRQALFHPSFWKEITFVFDDAKSLHWSRHLANCFALSVQNVTVRCQTPNYSLELERLLGKFRENRNLRKLYIEPTSSSFIGIDYMDTYVESWSEPIYHSIIKIIETSKQLEVLTTGCVEELSVNAGEIIECLANHQGKHISRIGLASVKEDPENYDLAIVNPIAFRQFEHLTVLTLDYDYLNDLLLESLTSGTMETLAIHIHNWNGDHPGASNSAWEHFTHKNKRCGLRLNLLHAYVGVTVLDSNILQPAMPLTHLKVLFCEHVNVQALSILSLWYNRTLQSLMWIDSKDENELLPPTDDLSAPGSPDALVLIAWRCNNLIEMVYIGHKYYQENMLAIARLRGPFLQRFEFAESNIISEDETPHKFKDIRREINKILGGNWKTLLDKELTPVLIDAIAGDSRDVIMPLVLNDVK